ncbi:DUF4231 domain-containing protein [Streptomyces xinghaiensis]|uniref:DUF4231 domain-containing protein n=1 Tax=Streptomyces xinghaiensis TaxID=1038928 RepID=UPI0005859708|nr:DUF4231 domain-containing protein [Streptomyces xinghaiensis]MZE79711.1 DUF4231 domain-containing protein [Streptomyces sp. SID5475]
MTGSSQDPAISAVWAQQSVWSQAAGRLKRQVVRARATALGLGVTAAALGTAASQTLAWNEAVGRTLAFAAAVAAGCAPLTGQRGGPGTVSDWTRLRAVSEALKTESYLYLAGVGAYRGDESGGNLLRERARGFGAGGGADLLRHTTGITAVERPVPGVRDVESYVEQRLRRQLEGYYRPRAAYMRRKVRLHERIEFALGGLGAVMAAVAAVWGVEWVAAWVAVAASVGVAATAHAVAQRYAYQQLEFTRTGEELERLLERWSAEREPAPEAADRFVADCEHVISVQNEAWMIRWTVG